MAEHTDIARCWIENMVAGSHHTVALDVPRVSGGGHNSLRLEGLSGCCYSQHVTSKAQESSKHDWPPAGHRAKGVPGTNA